jgi:hypothetical protein
MVLAETPRRRQVLPPFRVLGARTSLLVPDIDRVFVAGFGETKGAGQSGLHDDGTESGTEYLASIRAVETAPGFYLHADPRSGLPSH